MNEFEVRATFDYINRLGEFSCHETDAGEGYVSFASEVEIELLQRDRMIVDATFYFNDNVVIFVMFLSEGFWGDRVHLIDSLLLRLNGVIRAGSFAYWQNTAEIVFKQDLPIDYLDRDKLIRVLRYFERVYVAIKQRLVMYASDWGLRYINEEQKAALARDLEWYFRGAEGALTD